MAEHRGLEYRLSPRGNVLVGGNGQQPILWRRCSTGARRSHRGSRRQIGAGGDHFTRWGGQGDAGETLSIEAGFTPPRSKRLKVDGRPVTRLTDFLGVLACVSFGPEDAELTRGAPQLRRRYVDYALAQTSRSSLELLSQYRRTLQQRSALLRDARRRDDEIDRGLEVWDSELVRLGLALVERRATAIAELTAAAQAAFAELAPGVRLQVRYAVHAAGRSFDAADDWKRSRRSGDRRDGGELPGPPATAAGAERARGQFWWGRIATISSWCSRVAICGVMARRASAVSWLWR